MHDMALVYLDQMAVAPDCPPDLKPLVDYEAGVTLITGSRRSGSVMAQAKALDDARRRFEKFLAEHPEHPMASSARSQLANILVERGRMAVEASRQAGLVEAAVAQRLVEARRFYGEAQSVFAEAEKRLVELLRSLQSASLDSGDVKRLEQRDQARRELLEARLSRAITVFEIAMTHPSASTPRNEGLADAERQFGELHEKYGTLLAGLYARMWQGRCQQHLGNIDEAMAIFDALLAQDDTSKPMIDLKRKVLGSVLEGCLLAEPKRIDEAITRYEQWQSTAADVEAADEDTLAIHFFGSTAALLKARELPVDNAERKKSLDVARRGFKLVAASPGPHRQSAQLTLLEPLLDGSETNLSPPSDFNEALMRGWESLQRMQTAELQDRLDRSLDKHDDHARYEAEIAAARVEATRCFRATLALAPPDAPLEELNAARYYLAYLAWGRGELYDAAVLGEFLLESYPGADGTRQAAKIAMASWAKLVEQSPPGAQRDFAQSRMIALAQQITQQWPDSPEAADAFVTLLRDAVVRGDIDAAKTLLERLPTDSPRRIDAQRTLGRALWASWLRAMRLEADQRPPADQLDRMLDEARSLLADSVRPTALGVSVDRSRAAAALALAQIHLHDGDPQQAVKLLDNPTVGPVTLVAANHSAAADETFAVETYKTALRAYVAAGQLDRAERAMDALENLVPQNGDEAGAAALTQVYLSLARQLEELLQSLREQKKDAELGQLAGAFERFLERIATRGQGNTFHSLNWVAETLAALGSGGDAAASAPSPDAKRFLEKAADAYRAILDRSKTEPDFAPTDDAVLGVEVRLAQCLRRLGRFDEAMKLLVDVLTRRNLMVDAQMQAAYTYQAWAATKGDASKYLAAILGGEPVDPQAGAATNVVWGWGKLARLLARAPGRTAMFHEARYNLALCRYRYAMSLTGDDKTAMLQTAEKDITIVARLYPDLGGEPWRGKYDALLRTIQKALGQEPTGLNP